jgi:hypothetical protein
MLAARAPHEVTRRPTQSAAYVQALQTVNEFLHAWLNRDADTRLRLMSAPLLKPPRGIDTETYTSALRMFMTGLSNPHHQAFEIGVGRSRGGRYVFPIVLYEYYSGEPTAFRVVTTLEAVREGETWKVAHLPPGAQ